MSSVNDIRSCFLSYFAKNGHEVVDSSPLVPQNDPTLMFANSGMVQFKNLFTGVEARHINGPQRRKNVQAGGKHNDLENVGYGAHTFLKCLAIFIGDYFKENAIELAWRLITAEFGMDQKLLVTVYHEDDDAAALWRKIAGLRMIGLSALPSDNFWAMGDTGPCGPCSEIFYDHGDHIQVGRQVRQRRMVTALLKSGIWCLCSLNRLVLSVCHCQSHLLTPVWDLNGLPRFCRASMTIMISI